MTTEAPQYGVPGCTCRPFTRQGGTPRYLLPGESVNKISGWETGSHCPHHASPSPVNAIADRPAVLREAAAAIERAQDQEDAEQLARFSSLDHESVLQGAAVREKVALLRRMADEASQCPRCGDSLAGYADDDLVHLTGDPRPYCSGECVIAAHRAALKKQRQESPLTPMLAGLDSLLATSSRDWGSYRVDAWLYAVLVGWDCEREHQHDQACRDGAVMREVAERHGWSDAAVAKARAYRTAVRAVTGMVG